MTLQISIVLPVYNRTALLRHPLDSLRAAAAASPGLRWELIAIDDGSTEDVAAALAPYADLPLSLHRLGKNSGLLAARLEGLARARGDAVCFLDADDAVAPGKFTHQLPALTDADVVYSDVARRAIDVSGSPSGPLREDPRLPACPDPAEFYLSLQPGPHNPIFRRSYLQRAIDPPLFPAARSYDPIAETWFYYHLAVRPARIVHTPGFWTIVGEPTGERLSRRWERQALAALRLMRAFQQACPSTPATLEARRRVGRCAFATWRALPRNIPHLPVDGFLDVWRSAPPNPLPALGGRGFQRLAGWIGPERAARVLRRLQRPDYARIRTVTDEELRTWVQS